MNKDALFATLIGLGIGLLLTGIILVGPNIAKSIPNIKFPEIAKISLPSFSFPKKATPTITADQTKQTDSHTLIIDSPLESAIEQTESVLVSGSTSKGATVVIQGFLDDVVIDANGDGKYAGKITLAEGKNDIVVTSYNVTKEQKIQNLTVYYTPEEW
ncbi:MAG: hypothetical protein V1917_01835 [Candidatus Gottesmanbacteria bacterium]